MSGFEKILLPLSDTFKASKFAYSPSPTILAFPSTFILYAVSLNDFGEGRLIDIVVWYERGCWKVGRDNSHGSMDKSYEGLIVSNFARVLRRVFIEPFIESFCCPGPRPRS